MGRSGASWGTRLGSGSGVDSRLSSGDGRSWSSFLGTTESDALSKRVAEGADACRSAATTRDRTWVGVRRTLFSGGSVSVARGMKGDGDGSGPMWPK